MSTATPISRVNDFVVRFANVNGSGSASGSTRAFARAVMRGASSWRSATDLSNIQGLPTWYEVRVSEAGHLGARGGTDLMVAMNPQTFDKDIAAIEPGGYLILRFQQATAGVEIPQAIFRWWGFLSRQYVTANIPIRASASCSRTSSTSVRCRCCWKWMSPLSSSRSASNTRRGGQAHCPKHQGAAHRPRLCAAQS